MPIAELFALVLDGQVFRLGDAFAPLDLPDSPALRARAFAALGAGPAVADRGSAAWIHGTRSSPPLRPQVCIDPDRRGRLPSGMDAHQHELAAGDIVEFDGIRVTSALRTAGDLLLTARTFGRDDADEVGRLLGMCGADADVLRARLAGSRRNGAARAIRRLDIVAEAVAP